MLRCHWGMPISLALWMRFLNGRSSSKHFISKKLALRSVICLCCRSSTFSAAHEGPNHHFWALFGHPPPPPPENRTLVCHCQGQPSFFSGPKMCLGVEGDLHHRVDNKMCTYHNTAMAPKSGKRGINNGMPYPERR